MVPTFRAGVGGRSLYSQDIRIARISSRIQYEPLQMVRSECSVVFSLGRIPAFGAQTLLALAHHLLA
jgi:hypothetical protein